MCAAKIETDARARGLQTRGRLGCSRVWGWLPTSGQRPGFHLHGARPPRWLVQHRLTISRLLLVLLVLVLPPGPLAPSLVGAGPETAGPAPSTAAAPAGWPAFVIGASYEGPADRAWRGDYWAWWADDLFDPALVEADFTRASTAGLNAIRVFVQRDLLHDIRDAKWGKLDAVLDLADRYGLRVIVTLGDYDEPRVSQLAKIAGAIAERYSGRQTILAYDIRNEPTFWTLQTAIYPDKPRPPLLSRRLLETYGEQSAKFYIDAFRVSDEGKNGPLAIPERFSDDEAYVYHNNWILSYHLSLEATAWAAKTGRADVEYFSQPEAAQWKPLLEALDTTYAAWLGPQIQAIRAVDPVTPITLGQHDPLIAALPYNQQLDVITLHRYVSPGPDGVKDLRRQLLALRSMFPDKPILLGEFGYRATELGDDGAALEETATWLQLLADGFAGGLKWMLTDTRNGTDTMGLFRIDGSPRPVAYATAAVARLTAGIDAGASAVLTFDRGDDGATCYRFDRDRFLALGGRCFAGALPWELATGARQVFTRRDADGSYLLFVTASSRLVPRPAASGGIARWNLSEDGASGGGRGRIVSGSSPTDLEPGRVYRLAPAQ